jgi:predicted dinucleotide-binding enzyme
MSYAIIGFGKIGKALAKAVARGDIEVSAATSRDPGSFASPAAAIGPESLREIAQKDHRAFGIR